MIYIDKIPNPSGAYPNPKNQPFSGSITLTDEQAEMFFAYNGFIIVTETDDGVSVEPNAEAWEAWKAEHPESEEEPPAVETTVYDELDAAYQEGVNSAYDQ